MPNLPNLELNEKEFEEFEFFLEYFLLKKKQKKYQDAEQRTKWLSDLINKSYLRIHRSLFNYKGNYPSFSKDVFLAFRDKFKELTSNLNLIDKEEYIKKYSKRFEEWNLAIELRFKNGSRKISLLNIDTGKSLEENKIENFLNSSKWELFESYNDITKKKRKTLEFKPSKSKGQLEVLLSNQENGNEIVGKCEIESRSNAIITTFYYNSLLHYIFGLGWNFFFQDIVLIRGHVFEKKSFIDDAVIKPVLLKKAEIPMRLVTKEIESFLDCYCRDRKLSESYISNIDGIFQEFVHLTGMYGTVFSENPQNFLLYYNIPGISKEYHTGFLELNKLLQGGIRILLTTGKGTTWEGIANPHLNKKFIAVILKEITAINDFSLKQNCLFQDFIYLLIIAPNGFVNELDILFGYMMTSSKSEVELDNNKFMNIPILIVKNTINKRLKKSDIFTQSTELNKISNATEKKIKKYLSKKNYSAFEEISLNEYNDLVKFFIK